MHATLDLSLKILLLNNVSNQLFLFRQRLANHACLQLFQRIQLAFQELTVVLIWDLV